MTRVVALVAVLLSGASAAEAEWCRSPDGADRPAMQDAGRCKPEDRLVPFEPGQQSAGSRPGSIRVSPDTDVTVSGRVQVEYGVRR